MINYHHYIFIIIFPALCQQVKPLLMVRCQEETFKAKEELRVAVEKVKGLQSKIKNLERKLVTLSQEKNDLALSLTAVSRSLCLHTALLSRCFCAFMLHLQSCKLNSCSILEILFLQSSTVKQPIQ